MQSITDPARTFCPQIFDQRSKSLLPAHPVALWLARAAQRGSQVTALQGREDVVSITDVRVAQRCHPNAPQCSLPTPTSFIRSRCQRSHTQAQLVISHGLPKPHQNSLLKTQVHIAMETLSCQTEKNKHAGVILKFHTNC